MLFQSCYRTRHLPVRVIPGVLELNSGEYFVCFVITKCQGLQLPVMHVDAVLLGTTPPYKYIPPSSPPALRPRISMLH